MKFTAVLLCAMCAMAAAQSPSPSPSPVPAAPWVDPNLQTEGFQASMQGIGTPNPLSLVPAISQSEGMDLPNGGLTFSSQHNAEVSLDADNLWSYEFDGYNGDSFGLATLHNIKDPAWPTIYTLFDSVGSPDFAPIYNGEINKTDLDAIAQGMMLADGTELGYTDIFDAINDTSIAVVVRMGLDPTQAIAGLFGNDLGDSILVGGIGMPVDDTTMFVDESPAPARRLLRKLRNWA